MKVDQNTLLNEEEYIPLAGCEYEVAPGVVGTMRPITVKLQEDVFAKSEEGEQDDFIYMKMILAGIEDLEKGDCIYGMSARVVKDFFALLRLIVTKLSPSSDELDQSQQEENQEILES